MFKNRNQSSIKQIRKKLVVEHVLKVSKFIEGDKMIYNHVYLSIYLSIYKYTTIYTSHIYTSFDESLYVYIPGI